MSFLASKVSIIAAASLVSTSTHTFPAPRVVDLGGAPFLVSVVPSNTLVYSLFFLLPLNINYNSLATLVSQYGRATPTLG